MLIGNGDIAAGVYAIEGEAGRILDKLTPGVDEGIVLDAWPKLSLRLIAGTQHREFPNVLKSGVWQHVAVVVDRGMLRVYLNGHPPAEAN